MLKTLPQKFSIQPIVEQVLALGDFGKRLDLNTLTGEFFSDPWQTKDEFNNTPIGEVLASLGNIGQARLLCLESAESYTAHADPDDRIHVAVITNEFSYLVNLTDNILYHLPADGQAWYMNTGKLHVASNWGARTRIHINVRVLLPKFDPSRQSIGIKIIEGDYDWKQIAYTPILVLVNRYIKEGKVTGFKGISDKDLLLNADPVLFSDAINKIQQTGVVIQLTTLDCLHSS